MAKWLVNLVSTLLFTGLVLGACFEDRLIHWGLEGAFMLGLVLSAINVGQISRQPRSPTSRMISWIIGWPVFATSLVLVLMSCREMVVLSAPSWVLMAAFFWVLAYLTWKVFIDPNTGSGGWWRGGGGYDFPQPFSPRPPSAHKPLPKSTSLAWRKKHSAVHIATLN